jgi:hypothetical protein
MHYGDYQIEGKISTFAITISYSGKTNTEDMVGVVILIKSGKKNKLEGVWWQYGETHALKGGKTTWEKLS